MSDLEKGLMESRASLSALQVSLSLGLSLGLGLGLSLGLRLRFKGILLLCYTAVVLVVSCGVVH